MSHKPIEVAPRPLALHARGTAKFRGIERGRLAVDEHGPKGCEDSR